MYEDEYLPILQQYISGFQKRASSSTEKVAQTSVEVAKVVLNVAQMEQPPIRIRTSDWAEQFCQLKTSADPDGWKLVNKITKDFL